MQLNYRAKSLSKYGSTFYIQVTEETEKKTISIENIIKILTVMYFTIYVTLSYIKKPFTIDHSCIKNIIV